jgi:surfactin synthase thioesterase subunit/phosphopantetheinyl transferase (holo-ACP synthase)
MRVETSETAQLSRQVARSTPDQELTLVCLPYAGGDAVAFLRWSEALRGSARVVVVELPGRDGRRSDRGGIVVGDVADQVAAHAHAPYALYGHSMGARLAFEVVRELRRRGVPLPLRLYVGGAHPPHLVEPIARLAHLTEEQFLDQLILRAGTPAVVRDDPYVRAAVLPTLRIDLDWLRAYRYRPESPLPVPVVAFAGVDDQEVPDNLMLGWARHTSASFRLHTLVGDHLFIRTETATLTAMIAADLAAARDGRHDAPTVPPPAPDEIHVWRLALGPPGTGSARDGTADEVGQGGDAAFRAALRHLLRRYGVEDGDLDGAGADPGDPAFGGPTLAGLHRAVSRSAGTALVALGRRELAVDVEVLRPVTDLDDFCDRALTPAERAEVFAEPEEHQLSAALRRWTAREAVRKATAAAAAAPGTPTAVDWRVTELDLDDAVAAVATSGGNWRLRYEILGGLPR